MPPYDPRYRYPRGYDYGNVALGLADLLGQGFDRMHKWDQDAQGQTNRDQEYLMRLQQFMAQNEDRDLDREVKTQTLAGLTEDRATKAADRKASAATAASGRSGIAKLLKMPSDVTEETPPPPEFAGDPERLQPNILQSLVKRPRTRDEAMAGLTSDEAGHTEVFDRLLKLYPQKEPKAPEPYNLPQGTQRRGVNNELLADNPAEIKPKEPPAPSAERDYHAIAQKNLGPGKDPADYSKEARRLAQEDREAGFRAQGAATGAAMVNREQGKYDTAPIGDDAAKWIGAGGKSVNPGLSRKEAVAAGARPLSGVDEVKSLRAAAGLGRYLRQYIPLLDVYPDAGSSDAVNLLKSGVEGGKLWMARKSGGAASRIDALEGQITKLIRAWGDTANAAVAERTTTLKGVPGWVETKQSAREKLGIILDQAIGSFEDLGVEPPKDLLDLQSQLEGAGASGSPKAQSLLKKWGY